MVGKETRKENSILFDGILLLLNTYVDRSLSGVYYHSDRGPEKENSIVLLDDACDIFFYFHVKRFVKKN